MSKTYHFAGASSANALAALQMLRAEGHRVLGLSTKDITGLGYDETYTVNGYTKNELPELSFQRYMRRIGHARDVANAIRFLLSAESEWMTGQILHVDGGMSAIRPL